MLLFSTALKKHKLTFTKLSDWMGCLPIAAKWAESEWGYIRKKGIQYRMSVLRSLSDNIYIGSLADIPVAMFALLPHHFHKDLEETKIDLPHAYELMYVYVEKKYRGLGFGKQIVEEAKKMAARLGADLILLDTLKPSLNKFYEEYGAEVVCEGRLLSHPTDVLTIKI
jgi:GNAT superfamily N-acetyltransferase